MLAHLFQLALHVRKRFRIFRIGVDRVHFLRIFLQIKKLPLVDIVKVHQLVTTVANTVMTPDGMVFRKTIVVIIDRVAPVFWDFCPETAASG